MTREFLINTLRERGIDANPIERTCNGVKTLGIRLGNGTLCPCFYDDWYERFNESEVNIVIGNMLLSFAHTPQIFVGNLNNWEYAKTRLMVCLQQKGTEDICKRDFLDLEMYVRLVIDTDGDNRVTAKINKDILKSYGVSEDTLFETAMDCTKKSLHTMSLTELLEEMEIPEDKIEELVQNTEPMTTVTNKEKYHGASAIIFTDILQKIATEYDSDLVILPSSIHECLLKPIGEDTDFEMINFTIEDINETQLRPEQVLSNHYYLYIREENKIFTSHQEYEDFLIEEYKQWRHQDDLKAEIDTWFDILEANQISEEELYHTLLEKGITVDMIREFAGDEKADILQKFCKEN